ncbi:MAG: NAD(P)/FAD-dependent oxidoreductase [Acidimicrobiales bacterium]
MAAPAPPGPPPPPGRIARLASHLPARARRAASRRLPGAMAPPLEPGTVTPRIAIIGSGYGGIAMGCRLRQAGIETFTIHEKGEGIGGTWRDNDYPGAACDVPSALYSLSFAPKPDWSRTFPAQPEILGYLEGVVDDFGLRPHLRLRSELASAEWDDAAACWHLAFADGRREDAEVLVAATGQLNRPHIPDIAGLASFGGPTFHSARWDHDHDLTDERVGVIGIGASAIQFVPPVARQAQRTTLFQRTTNYVAPKRDPERSEAAKAAFARLPGLQRLYRWSIWLRFEARWVVFRRGSRLGRVMQRAFQREIAKLASDDLPLDALVPDHPLGCRRILISSDWYPTLARPDVEVVTSAIDRIEPGAVVTADGRRHELDALVFGTGFESTGFLAPIRITGRHGVDLHERWADGAEAHLGIAVAGFPNLFVLYGPNTNLGHNSIVFMLERQVAYALTLVRRLIERGEASAEVRADAQARSNRRIQAALAGSVWAEGCRSWYKTASGKITNNWPGPTVEYWWRTLVPRAADYEARPGVHSGAERPPG